jgi:hypothetical protein
MVCDLAGTLAQGASCYDIGTLRMTGYWSVALILVIALGRRIVR